MPFVNDIKINKNDYKIVRSVQRNALLRFTRNWQEKHLQIEFIACSE